MVLLGSPGGRVGRRQGYLFKKKRKGSKLNVAYFFLKLIIFQGIFKKKHIYFLNYLEKRKIVLNFVSPSVAEIKNKVFEFVGGFEKIW